MAPLSQDYADASCFAYLTGWPRGEVVSLGGDAVDRAAGEVRLKTSKNGRGRVLPLEGELRDLIERRWSARQVTTPRGEALRRVEQLHTHQSTGIILPLKRDAK
jgi:integrase